MSNSITPSLPAKPPASHAEGVVNSHSTSISDVSENIDEESPTATNSVRDKHGRGTASPPTTIDQPPLPSEEPPPLPNEPIPDQTGDDGWEPVWDEHAQAFYFYNRLTQITQWDNPRIPQATAANSSKVEDTGPPGATLQQLPKKHIVGGYDPAIHGDYDPNADYAKAYDSHNDDDQLGPAVSTDPALAYAATGAFNRFTGKWQSAEINPEKFNDENKSKRQMNAFFDVDAAANSHDGRSLKAERSSKKLTKQELKAYREKRKEKKEEKRRAWLRD